MKARTCGISLAFIAGFALTASCGGSSEISNGSAGSSSGGQNSHAGSSAHAGAIAHAGSSTGDAGEANESSGGEAGSGGEADSGEAGSGGAPDEAGGTSNGGASHGGTTGGGGAKPNAGGGGGGSTNPASCPASAPTDATACTSPTSNQTLCVYPGERCTCRAQSGGGPGGGNAGGGGASVASREWSCEQTVICPAAKPTVGDACTTAQGTCQYQNMGTCRCGQSEKWTCNGGNSNACPATQPVVGSACTGSTQCGYNDTDCICLSQKWACN
jgi:hypothetical protein